jgi:hypothetical protein
MRFGTPRAQLAIILFIGVTAVSAACVSPANPNGRFMPKGCYEGLESVTPYPDLYFSGTPNVLNNGTEYVSTNGSCTNRIVGMVTIVRASGIPTAGAECAKLKLTGPITLGYDTYQKMPTDAFICS